MRISPLVPLGIAISAGLFALFAATAVCTKPNAGNISGAVISAALLTAIIKRNTLLSLMKFLRETVWGRSVLTLVFLVILTCIAAAVFISVMMIKAANIPPETPQTVIVLGCRVKENGPSLMLEKRIEAAYEYLSENPEVICIASGGKGDDEPVSEAECIRDRLVEKGIASDRIIMEDKSENTFQNLKFSGQILDSLELERSAIIITNEFHQLRAGMIARKQGYTVYSKSAPPFLPLLPSYWIREWLGVTHEFLIGRK